jgi:3-oxoacyl-[acyl-carrier-protein] synthase II
MRRVAITGLGIVCPLGNSVSEAVANAFAGKSGIRSNKEYMWGEYGEKIPVGVGGTVVDFDESKFVPERFKGIYDPIVTFALAAAEEALTDSGIDFTEQMRDRTGVLIATAVTGSYTWHKMLHQVYAEKKAEELPGHYVMQVSGNMPAGLVALKHKFRGPNVGIVNACASGGTTMGIAADYIRTGRADVIVAGGTESAIGPAMCGSLAGAHAIHQTHDPERACRPFSIDRAGLVIGEGSAIVIMEPMDQAEARGAKIYGEFLGDAQTNDAYHIISPDPSGDGWERTINIALEAAGIDRSEVDYISAHAASTKLGDLVETMAIKKTFGDRAYEIPVSATKSMHGHSFGATGAIEGVLALAAMCQGKVLPTISLTKPDPECDLDYVPNVGREQESHVLMKNSFGFGGTNSVSLIRRML